MKDQLKNAFLSNWTPAEKGLLLADVLLAGVLLGWLTSPFRKTAGNMAKVFVDTIDGDNDEDDEIEIEIENDEEDE